MYNRYIRNQQGNFTRIKDGPDSGGTSPFCGPPPPGAPGEKKGGDLLSSLLQKLGIGHIDTGDLLLLLILFLLFSEGEDRDEELLIALGLLLIL